ncbi:MAG: nicotinamide mononucleotide transporter [Bacteroidaceae bacterium]|nr:nicotinamide mononucleotide transporter [Bacteroidaceae bacterium]MBR5891178.1 nicotinamide mononucleotide transporter [Bacteroidaceae bacterium]
MTLELLGTVVGVIYLWLEYRASIYLWIAGIVMPAIYIFIYYDAGLYADFGINIYYLLIALYGWLAWKTGFRLWGEKLDVGELPISHAPKRVWPRIAVAYIVAQLFIAWILINYTDSTVPLADSFTTALSIVGMWMLARKYIEQWWVWCVVDVASSALYIYKELYFTALLYAVYAIIAIFGYRKWKKMMQHG